ncbi:Tad domain-containing protein [Rhizobium sp. RU36D]|uniref:TadE/TadG family type IV pilus assembly protein n=1 Tax=Rhizobium sp. RU36D TaxID=1907415 RepID=UPI0024530996|nr:Tad domain-containing protein [Rhizobium sp. RU36D]
MTCTEGNFGIITALLIPLLLVAAGGAVDVNRAFSEKDRLQGLLDSAMLAAAHKTTPEDRLKQAKSFLATASTEEAVDFEKRLQIAQNADGSITGNFTGSISTPFLNLIGISNYDIAVKSTAIASTGTESSGACIYVLGSKGQDVLINSGANVYSKECGVHVHSTANPAFIMNAGAKIDTPEFCVKGTKYIKNGGTLTNLATNCAVDPDPYAGKLPEPTVPSICTTSGWKDGQSITLKPGLHCETGFNGSPTITFEPGLHIIKGRMIINSNATVKAEGVTFYFADVNSEIRINGGVKFTGTAPTSGTYKGILMFENTSNAANAANKQQYIFNGSLGEVLQGIIYLPNRDVTYNSTTNQVSEISLVVNTIIMNSANWLVEPYTGNSGNSSAATGVRLLN